MNLGQRLKELRQRKKLTMEELSDKLNEMYPNEEGKKRFAKGNFSKWETGKSDPSVTTIAKVAKYFDVSLDYLLGLEDMPQSKIKYPVVEVPVLRQIEKDEDIYKYENIIDEAYIPNHLKISHQKLLYLKQMDDSMNLVAKENEIFLVNMDVPVKTGDIGVFIVEDEDIAIVRKIEVIGDNILLTPQSTNDKHTSKIYKEKDVQIIGRVISSIHHLTNNEEFPI